MIESSLFPEPENFSADELLRHYLDSPGGGGEFDRDRLMTELVEVHAAPLIDNYIRRRRFGTANNGFVVSPQDSEDLCSEARLNIATRLNLLRSSDDGAAILHFDSYVRAVAENVLNKYFSRDAPNRRSLKNKVRYALGKSPGIEVWSGSDELYCGVAGGDRDGRSGAADELAAACERGLVGYRNLTLVELISGILGMASAPVAVNDLLTVVARLWDVEDHRDVSLDAFSELRAASKSPPDELEMRLELEQLWQEIRALPVNQRIALLYNLRDEDGREMLLMFFNIGIATLRGISEAMNLTPLECAGLLPLLPMDDKTIAARMGLTAKQVSNLRKVARDNLRRRLAGKQKRERRDGEKE